MQTKSATHYSETMTLDWTLERREVANSLDAFSLLCCWNSQTQTRTQTVLLSVASTEKSENS